MITTELPSQTPTGPLSRIKLFLTFFDSRWEDLDRKNWLRIIYQDFSAGLIVAMTAIPMAMGFAMAMGMRPEHGIIAGALACAVGRTFGGSKYQVYGPTAAFIPVIASLGLTPHPAPRRASLRRAGARRGRRARRRRRARARTWIAAHQRAS
jgi:hypothetical protein